MRDDDYLSPEMQEVALAAQVGCNTWDVAEHIGIAQGVLLHVVERLKSQAVERFDRCGFMDPRGAAIWDCAAFVNETLIGDPLRRRFADNEHPSALAASSRETQETSDGDTPS